MLLTIVLWWLVIRLALETLAAVATVDQQRKPVTRGHAVGAVIAAAFIIYVLLRYALLT